MKLIDPLLLTDVPGFPQSDHTVGKPSVDPGSLWSLADLLTSSHPQISASHLLGLQIRGDKNVYAIRREGVKSGSNFVHVVAEWPLSMAVAKLILFTFQSWLFLNQSSIVSVNSSTYQVSILLFTALHLMLHYPRWLLAPLGSRE